MLTDAGDGLICAAKMTYEYVCTACGNEWEASQPITAAPLKECPSCHESTARRQVSGGTGFVLKGGGWYADLYGSTKPKSEKADKADSKDSGTSKPSGSEGSSTPAASSTTSSESTSTSGTGSKSSGSASPGA